MARKRSRLKNPYLLIVGIMALISVVWGKQIQAWVLSLPPDEQRLPFMVVMLLVATAFAAIYIFQARR